MPLAPASATFSFKQRAFASDAAKALRCKAPKNALSPIDVTASRTPNPQVTMALAPLAWRPSPWPGTNGRLAAQTPSRVTFTGRVAAVGAYTVAAAVGTDTALCEDALQAACLPIDVSVDGTSDACYAQLAAAIGNDYANVPKWVPAACTTFPSAIASAATVFKTCKVRGRAGVYVSLTNIFTSESLSAALRSAP